MKQQKNVLRVHILDLYRVTLPKTNIAMENGPFQDVFPIENGDIPLLC